MCIRDRSLLNTLFILLLAGGIALLLGWLFGSAAARLPLPIGIVIGILLSIGSLCALFPSWISLLFSSDSYGLLNAVLLEKGTIQTPILWTQLHANEIQVLILALLSLAPSYLIFFIAGRSNRRRAAWHIAVTAVPVIILAGWMAVSYTHLDVYKRQYRYSATYLACATSLIPLLLSRTWPVASTYFTGSAK